MLIKNLIDKGSFQKVAEIARLVSETSYSINIYTDIAKKETKIIKLCVCVFFSGLKLTFDAFLLGNFSSIDGNERCRIKYSSIVFKLPSIARFQVKLIYLHNESQRRNSM